MKYIKSTSLLLTTLLSHTAFADDITGVLQALDIGNPNGDNTIVVVIKDEQGNLLTTQLKDNYDLDNTSGDAIVRSLQMALIHRTKVRLYGSQHSGYFASVGLSN
ncbi:hypothetical protein [Vibrio parahaemolyticus]|uniref:hypothetical protein n=1 Tax=Vibrio parahaemolyticus TaxID=670 RepID=UPI002360A22D|nr:hypothetical protein [Vibrio parahaemolyticus]